MRQKRCSPSRTISLSRARKQRPARRSNRSSRNTAVPASRSRHKAGFRKSNNKAAPLPRKATRTASQRYARLSTKSPEHEVFRAFSYSLLPHVFYVRRRAPPRNVRDGAAD
ncbi:protein of unknown function [Paraburkholderia kururiensis]